MEQNANFSTSNSPLIGQLEGGNDGQCEKGERHKRIDLARNAQIVRGLAQLFRRGQQTLRPARRSSVRRSPAEANRCAPRPTTAIPPPIRTSSRAAAAMSALLSPRTMILCESCATVVGDRPAPQPAPLQQPRPIFPVPRCRSMTASFKSSVPRRTTSPSSRRDGTHRPAGD